MGSVHRGEHQSSSGNISATQQLAGTRPPDGNGDSHDSMGAPGREGNNASLPRTPQSPLAAVSHALPPLPLLLNICTSVHGNEGDAEDMWTVSKKKKKR